MKWLFKKIFKESIDGVVFQIGELLDHVKDSRDFKYSMLGGMFGYTPKHRRLELPIRNVKNQRPNNTCVFHSYASCREVSEGVILSPRSMVAYAKKAGLLKADGISSIRNGQTNSKSVV